MKSNLHHKKGKNKPTSSVMRNRYMAFHEQYLYEVGFEVEKNDLDKASPIKKTPSVCAVWPRPRFILQINGSLLNSQADKHMNTNLLQSLAQPFIQRSKQPSRNKSRQVSFDNNPPEHDISTIPINTIPENSTIPTQSQPITNSNLPTNPVSNQVSSTTSNPPSSIQQPLVLQLPANYSQLALKMATNQGIPLSIQQHIKKPFQQKDNEHSENSGKKGKTRSNFTPQQRQLLEKFFYDHLDHPYAERYDLEMLERQTNLSRKQIRVFMTNARMRKFNTAKTPMMKLYKKRVATIPSQVGHQIQRMINHPIPPQINTKITPNLISPAILTMNQQIPGQINSESNIEQNNNNNIEAPENIQPQQQLDRQESDEQQKMEEEENNEHESNREHNSSESTTEDDTET
ncbi:hypothetical protein TRFO_38468 [Tritrichomonas foetus]|uniref:Homeobox domain-containing protein n=1 Tax=Tritrichomonas foetus TaxID=1144522 RepID=A0A1J4JCS0_9EUKA|nr:hypothetical protein TRFO_38468 [Tritrichomonas foetus]|eukprot:OHS95459.1 hypothetical protein TRFO_38468 [Tritrichomonas foetus]